jgi:hypothetical protein
VAAAAMSAVNNQGWLDLTTLDVMTALYISSRSTVGFSEGVEPKTCVFSQCADKQRNKYVWRGQR